MVRLEIDTQSARIAIDSRPADLDLTRSPSQLTLKRQPSVVSIHTEQPAVELDLSEPFADMGLKKSEDMTREWAQAGMSNAMKYIAAQAQDGDALARIEDGPSVAQVTSRRAWPHDSRQLNIGVVPKSFLQLEVKGGVNIETRRGTLDVRVTPGKVTGSYRPGGIRTRLAVRPQIDMRVVGDRYSALA